MSGLIEPHLFWETAYRYRLSRRPASGHGRCRCGALLRSGTSSYGFEEVPDTLLPWLGRPEFCSVRCARAFMLELMEVLQVSAAPAVLSDFEEVISSVQALLVLTENERLAALPPSTPLYS